MIVYSLFHVLLPLLDWIGFAKNRLFQRSRRNEETDLTLDFRPHFMADKSANLPQRNIERFCMVLSMKKTRSPDMIFSIFLVQSQCEEL